jgi:hypothetical protein
MRFMVRRASRIRAGGSWQQRIVEERDHASLVLGRARRESADVP